MKCMYVYTYTYMYIYMDPARKRPSGFWNMRQIKRNGIFSGKDESHKMCELKRTDLCVFTHYAS